MSNTIWEMDDVLEDITLIPDSVMSSILKSLWWDKTLDRVREVLDSGYIKGLVTNHLLRSYQGQERDQQSNIVNNLITAIIVLDNDLLSLLWEARIKSPNMTPEKIEAIRKIWMWWVQKIWADEISKMSQEQLDALVWRKSAKV
jgi:hypothetical protein